MGQSVTRPEFIAELEALMRKIDELGKDIGSVNCTIRVNGTFTVRDSLSLAQSYINDAAFALKSREKKV